MLKVYGLAFTATMADLGRAIEALNSPGNAEVQVAAAMMALERDLPGLPLGHVVRREFERLRETLRLPNSSRDTVKQALYNFESNLHQDLLQHTYFLIPAIRRPYFETPDLFGPAVAQEFPDAARDIAEAGRCIALDEYTAAVFHLMRASELGLQRLADGLGIQNAEWSQWGSLLKNIDGVLRAWEDETKTPERDRRIEYYSQARNDFAGFNNAWRKHVMHAREFYGEAEALRIFGHVGDLMRRLAEGLPS